MSFVAIVLTLAVALVLWVRWQEPRSIYFPVPQVGAYALPAGFAPQDVALTTPDGVRLHGWFCPAAPAGSTTDLPGTGLAVLYLHGNAGNLSNRIEKIRLLESLGLDVLIVD